MVNNFKCRLISWEEILEFSRIVAEKIQFSKFKPDIIVGITRGGWIPSMLLSDELGIKDLVSLKIEHWGITATKDKKARIKYPLRIDLSGKNVLLVDDLTDTGDSIKLAIKHLEELNAKEIRTATLLHKSQSIFEPDFYAQKVERWVWIILPWNLNEDLKNLIGKIWDKNKEFSVENIQEKLRKEFGIEVEKEKLQQLLDKKILKKSNS